MEPEQDAKLPYAERIVKLLCKAESTDSAPEAEALTAKAQELMTHYGISDVLLAQAEGRQIQETVIEDSIVYSGTLHTARFDIGKAVARAQNCRVLITKMPKSNTKMHIIGFASDVRNAKLFDASVQLQASVAMRQWYDAQRTDGLSKMDKFKMRRQFLMSFAQGLSAKLEVAKRAGVDGAVTDEAARAGVSEATARTSTELVLRTRTEQVNDWVDKTYGSTLRSVRRSYQHGGYGAADAGYNAGKNANVGQPGLGRRRELGS